MAHRVPGVPHRSSSSALLAALAWLSLCLQTGCTAPTAPRPESTGSRPPNILLILTDDLRHDVLGCAGDRVAMTPAIDALATHGVRFRNAFVTTSICAASRASIFTGLHERTHGYTFGTPPLADDILARSYPTLLRQSGYRTGFVGKFGVRIAEGGATEMFDVFRPSGQTYAK